jgi:hypothetical protein
VDEVRSGPVADCRSDRESTDRVRLDLDLQLGSDTARRASQLDLSQMNKFVPQDLLRLTARGTMKSGQKAPP